MSCNLVSKWIKSNLLRSVLRNDQKQFNQQLKRWVHEQKRTVYEKTTTTPAKYITTKVIVDKVMEFQPQYGILAFGVVAWSYYFKFFGIDFNEIMNMKDFRAVD